MAAIQLLLTDDGNRHALASLVSERHTPITEPDLQTADLYLVDDASLPQYQDTLDAHKREQAPVFCPVVLIRRDRTPFRIELPEPDPDERPFLINEVVTAPVDKQVLFRRIGNLLVRRRQTTDLQDANERLEHFASTLRHELRNPLQVLEGGLDVARSRGNSEALGRCQRAVNQMEKLLEETLLVLQSDDPEIEQELIDLGAMCAESWGMTPGSDSQLEITTTQQVYADKKRLRQLIENLFRNAVEHGGNNVTVTVGELDDGFYIGDDGPGIPEDERDQVFEQGYSMANTGTGLGLAVVDTVVDIHGWELQLTEGTEGGARFEVVDVDLA